MVYLYLFHGRKTRTEVMDNWGTTGPILGPFSWVHTTYSTFIHLGALNGDELGDLTLVDDMVFYEGVYYGDWSVISAETVSENRAKGYFPEIRPYEEAKAQPLSEPKNIRRDTLVTYCRDNHSEVGMVLVINHTYANAREVARAMRDYALEWSRTDDGCAAIACAGYGWNWGDCYANGVLAKTPGVISIEDLCENLDSFSMLDHDRVLAPLE